MGEERHKRFTKKRIALCAAVVLFAAVVGLLVAGHDSTPMPVYKGKTAKEWLYSRGRNIGSARADAFHAMGSNAVPFLVHELARKNTIAENLNEWLYVMVPQRIRRHLSQPVPAILRQTLASEGLLNANSRSAIPPLLRVVAEGNGTQRYAAASIVNSLVKPKDTNLVLQLTMCLNQNDPLVSLTVAATLDVLHSGEVAIPTLTNIIGGTDASESEQAWKLLRKFDPTNAAKWDAMFTNRSSPPAFQPTNAPK